MRWSSPWRRILFTPVPWLLVVGGVVAQYLVIDEAAADVEGESAAGWVLMTVAAVPVVWAVTETIWLRFTGPRIMVGFARLLTLPFLMGPLLGLSGALMRRKPGIEDTIVASRRPDGWHYWYESSQTMRQEVTLMIGANTISALILGIAAIVFIALPTAAFIRPAEFAEASQLDTSAEHAATNAAVVRALSIILVMVFALPVAVMWLRNEDQVGAAWLVGLLALSAGVALVRLVLSRQVPDRAARADPPAWGLGIQTPRHEARRRSADPD